ncbi:type IV secretion system protein [sulfur-oxidizing endosymbiont of Gigantopelta aegis]|uniref:type IV secretion system protein n=1 Tax=sulfur-oxidizing endosymbiont of Gigantopelta aegis TaxID=2794934 RepID=UPI0018DC5935|nr:type IV secretion system protein [sulfur-oxidizing endosymbiont of Gigantopelta aegis]
MKKKIRLIAFILFGFGSTQSQAGIPVIDATNLAQQIIQVANMVQQLARLAQQVQTAQSQLQTANNTLQSMSGSRGMGSVLNSVYDPNMAVNTNSILQNNGLQTAQNLGINGATAALYNAANNLSAQYLGQTGKTLQQAQTRFNEIMRLVNKVNAVPDQKDVLDLQARIGAENAMLQNELIKIAALRAQNEANQAILERKEQQLHLQYSGEADDINW